LANVRPSGLQSAGHSLCCISTNLNESMWSCRPEAWGNKGGIKCAMETLPVTNRSASLDVGTDWRLYAGAQEVLPTLRRVPVHFVDITALSELRKDAHTSVHTLRQGKLLTPEQQADPKTYADCIHWCLPGLPDTWNQFLYARIASSPWPADASKPW
jgi:hypothetical protein